MKINDVDIIKNELKERYYKDSCLLDKVLVIILLYACFSWKQCMASRFISIALLRCINIHFH